ncbi:MAG: hypothetical protein CMG93_10275 [Marinomonas sp.]|uniref:DUF3329 domain-containing protein n=1 Tax=Marinomonas communis TaxID=28254 RepID=A0A4R6X117_9GAMM|nr:hypothetical protein [Marinomonas communis]MAF16356.1 hypothetical protein [Marinomonas sp.]MCC4273237.1 hypothetical protein [Marinomonas communis]RUM55105.1 MAG: hypothetical protein DSY86_02425 [Marinomonas sp.]RUM57416.1 MAG: hypothetical protein DSY85_01020 [Marinomonas sp.]TDR12545.1 hypothetical protein C8D85_2580 [Marinomonas communis]
MNDAEQNFFRPKWRRVAITIFCAGWSALEWLTGNPFWGVIFTAMFFYCLWKYWYTFDENSSAE